MKQFDQETSSVGNPLCNRNRAIVAGLVLSLLCVLLGIIIWQATTSGDNGSPDNVPSITTLPPPSGEFPLPVTIGNVTVDKDVDLTITYDYIASFSMFLSSKDLVNQSVKNCSSVTQNVVDGLCIEFDGHSRLIIKQVGYHGNPRENRESNFDIDCYDVHWTALNQSQQMLQSCVNVSIDHWYGGYADKHQFWPFDKNSMKMSAYIVNDSYMGEIGGVVERYFISSSGFGVYIDDAVPLYFNLNDPDVDLMCFTAMFENYPYFNLDNRLPFLKYTLCHGGNVKKVHSAMSNMFIDKPKDIPDAKLFKYPIWSTWAQFHKDVNQTNVISFANEILSNNFTHAQIEIDDDWTPHYGDMIFDEDKFTNATAMVKTLNGMGFRVTVWVHPFFNIDSDIYSELANKGYLVRTNGSAHVVQSVSWWDGTVAGILDVSNEEACKWYLTQLRNLTTLYNISSFKFDAGETSWLPKIYSAANIPSNPSNMYPGKWVDIAFRSDNITRHQEVRAMYRTQRYPIFVRMMDKLSYWGHDNGLKSIIPGVLTYGILGYPFILPDMIGGNAYNNQPDPELFIRWIQLNAFLPGLQFSIAPWNYNETVVAIARKYTELHEKISGSLIKSARNAVLTGEPIIRPLWWLAPDDEVALLCEDEFLLGDEYLIAPIVDQGARSRDIYFPPGEWLDVSRGGNYTGPGWWYNYNADIDELPYFSAI